LDQDAIVRGIDRGGSNPKDGGFCATKVGNDYIRIVVFIDLKESSEILIVEGVALLFKTSINLNL
jgi:hypothetical protein